MKTFIDHKELEILQAKAAKSDLVEKVLTEAYEISEEKQDDAEPGLDWIGERVAIIYGYL